jgi:hypothetical protein
VIVVDQRRRRRGGLRVRERALTVGDVGVGLVKSVVFGLIMALARRSGDGDPSIATA